jgi:hypothetical protein
MNNLPGIFMTGLLLAGSLLCTQPVRAQKAYPVEVNGLLSRIPIPESSAACYVSCTKSTDSSNGVIDVRDNGPIFKALQDEFMKIAQTPMAADGSTTPSMTTPPTPEQIEQMKQQALQRAAQMQNMTPQQIAQMQQGAATSQPRDNVELMKLIGQAQTACGQISRLNIELSDKVARLDKSPIDKVKMGPNCPEVQQGGYAGPTCGCMIAHATGYATGRVAARDEYLKQVRSLLLEYQGKIRPLVATVDDAVARAKYGDAVVNPAFKQQVVSIQRQALGSVSTVMAIAGSNWEDAGKQYAELINAKSGASVGCFGRK